jgi:hypothetical protein
MHTVDNVLKYRIYTPLTPFGNISCHTRQEIRVQKDLTRHIVH